MILGMRGRPVAAALCALAFSAVAGAQEFSHSPDIMFDDAFDGVLVGPSNDCSIGRIRVEALFGLFAIFGIAWFNRGRRRE